MVGLKPGLVPVAFVFSLVVAPMAARAEALSAADVSVMAASCMNCHGPQGVSPGAMASIAGRAEPEIAQMLLAYRAGTVPGATVMTRIMKGFDEAEVTELARYYAALPAGRVR